MTTPREHVKAMLQICWDLFTPPEGFKYRAFVEDEGISAGRVLPIIVLHRWPQIDSPDRGIEAKTVFDLSDVELNPGVQQFLDLIKCKFELTALCMRDVHDHESRKAASHG